jgi:hypothetical protein
MFKAAQDKTIGPARAKVIVDGVLALEDEVKNFLISRVKEIDELAKSVGRKAPLPPSFQIPAIALPEPSPQTSELSGEAPEDIEKKPKTAGLGH